MRANNTACKSAQSAAIKVTDCDVHFPTTDG